MTEALREFVKESTTFPIHSFLSDLPSVYFSYHHPRFLLSRHLPSLYVLSPLSWRKAALLNPATGSAERCKLLREVAKRLQQKLYLAP